MTAFDINDRIQEMRREWIHSDNSGLSDNLLRKHFGDLAPRLTDAELEAKIKACIASEASWPNAIRREFSTVACGDGVDWKAKWEATLKERDEARKQADTNLREGRNFFEQSCKNLKRAEAAERERDEAIKQRDEWIRLSIRDSTERDALAASVRELEGKASTLDDMLGLIHALDDANTDDFARREGLHIAALLNHVRDNKKLKALIAELEARNGK